jgi:hypothetical protein
MSSRVLTRVTCALFAASFAFGRADRRSITGTISDPAGAVTVGGGTGAAPRSGQLVARLTF